MAVQKVLLSNISTTYDTQGFNDGEEKFAKVNTDRNILNINFSLRLLFSWTQTEEIRALRSYY